MLLVEYILGARRGWDGLVIDPCLTAEIEHARVVRKFRGATYEIELDNTAGRCKGATSITLDGEPVQGNVLPVQPGGRHQVKVII
jgi:cellobiose phosphorylase